MKSRSLQNYQYIAIFQKFKNITFWLDAKLLFIDECLEMHKEWTLIAINVSAYMLSLW